MGVASTYLTNKRENIKTKQSQADLTSGIVVWEINRLL
jgi:hypothetical protein